MSQISKALKKAEELRHNEQQSKQESIVPFGHNAL